MSGYLQFDDAKEILEAHAPVVSTGGGWFKTLCPAHDDEHPSLTFHIGRRDGNFVPNCQVGCSARSVVRAIHRLAGDTVPSDRRGRRLRDYLRTKPERTDEELADLFGVTRRTIQRWIVGFRNDGLAWKLKSHSKVYDPTNWSVRDKTNLKGSGVTNLKGSGVTSGAEIDSGVTQRERTLPDDGGEGGGDGVAATSSPPLPEGEMSSDISAKNVVSHVVDYEYLDPITGGLIALKRRHVETKKFEWWHPKGNDIRKGLGRLKEKHLPLYNSHRLAKRDLGGWVFIVEGEKAADALSALGFMAVCFAGGAHAKDFGYNTWADLINRRILYWPDNDKAGEKLMHNIEEKIDASVLQSSWIEVEVPAGGDAYDFIEVHGQGDGEFKDGAHEAVEVLIPSANEEEPRMIVYCRECGGKYSRHVGRLCPNPKCINNPAYKGKPRRSRP